MAGIGFALRQLAREDNIAGMGRAFIYATLISAGPWLITILSLGIISGISDPGPGWAELDTFRTIVIYNFALSLIVSGPLALIATRFVADAIFARDAAQVSGMALSGLAITLLASAVVAVALYGPLSALPPLTSLAAGVNLLALAMLWFVAAFLTAMKDYRIFIGAFTVGTALALGGAVAGAHLAGVDGMLGGYTVGILVIGYGSLSRILREFPSAIGRPFAILNYLRRYPEIAVSGLVLNAGVWIDKWVMWAMLGHSTGDVPPTFPPYDSAMFLACLTIVPALAIFTMSTETHFYELYHRFYRDIGGHATLAAIRANHKAIVRGVSRVGRSIFVIQGVISLSAILLAPKVLELTDASFSQIGMFRLGVAGAFFHASFTFMIVLLSYFDLRRNNLALQTLFLLLNGALTYATVLVGSHAYGYGYFAASLICAAAAFVILLGALRRLPYIAFIERNEAVAP